MKLTKYAQSCVLVESKGKRILVDPGNINYEDSLLEKDWANVNAILVTHRHSDHCHDPAIKALVGKGARFYSTREVAEAHSELSPEIVKQGDEIELGGLKARVVKAVHGYHPLMKDGKAIKENVGFIINDGEASVYLTSDTICFENDFKCDIIFVPVCNHCVTMGASEAALFAKETGARIVVPCHYDSPKHPVDLEQVKKEFEKEEVEYTILESGESIEV